MIADRVETPHRSGPIARAGERRVPPATAASDRAGDYKVVCVRLRVGEFEQFARDVAAMGLTSSMAMRIAARRIAGFLEIDRATRGELEAALREIGAVSGAVRALHAAWLDGGLATPVQLRDQCDAFGCAFVRLDASLRSILNVAQRRLDGRALLAAAA